MLNSFNQVVDSIQWTKDYPKEGIRFADLSRTFGLPALGRLVTSVVQYIAMEPGQAIVGVPTRGCTWASILGLAANVPAYQLTKQGVGTPLPGRVPLCASDTVYSDKASQFLISPEDVKRLVAADVVWVADDVCESGKTLSSVRKALEDLGCRDVRCIALMSIDKALDDLYSVIDYVTAERRCYPGIKTSDVNTLFQVRGLMRRAFHVAVYAAPTMQAIAMDYINVPQHSAVMGDVQWDTFAGGMPNVHFEYNGGDIVFIYDASAMSTTQDAVVHALARNCTGWMKVFIPYLPQGTMERVDQEGTLATAQSTLHSLCASMPMTSHGPVVVEILDIHQTGTRFYTTDRVQYRPLSILSQLVPSAEAIAFPDDGAYKRFKHLFPDRVLFVFSKIRQGDKRVIQLSEVVGDVSTPPTHFVIVDDLTRTGGTILNTARVLRERDENCHITACFVHADLDPGRSIPFARSPLLDQIVCSNSCPVKSQTLYRANPDKVKIKSVFGDAVQEQKTLVLASESPEKVRAVQIAYGGHRGWVYCGPVPSGIHAQPVGEAEIVQGVENRAKFAGWIAPGANILAIESGLVESGEEEYVDRVYVGTHNWAESKCHVSKHLVEEAREKGEEVGAILQKRHNLANKSAWLVNRTEQIMEVLKKVKF